jgi:hypothetical protein
MNEQQLFDENLIPEVGNENFTLVKIHNGTSFGEDLGDVSKLSVPNPSGNTTSLYYNLKKYAEVFFNDCASCGNHIWADSEGNPKPGYQDVNWGDILILGLGLGVVAEYALNTKSPTSIDVVESNQDLIDTVTWISDDINVINHDELTYQTSKKYDLIVYDIIQFDIPSNLSSSILNNYANNVKENGKIIIPVIGEIIN